MGTKRRIKRKEVIKIMNEKYENIIRTIANQLEELRLEMYPQIQDNDEDKQYFDNKLFSLQSQLRELATTAGLLEYK